MKGISVTKKKGDGGFHQPATIRPYNEKLHDKSKADKNTDGMVL